MRKNISLILTFTTAPCSLTSCKKNNVFTYPPSINISDESYIKKIIMNNNVNGRQTEWQSFLHHKFLKSSKLLNSAFLTTNNKLENYW